MILPCHSLREGGRKREWRWMHDKVRTPSSVVDTRSATSGANSSSEASDSSSSRAACRGAAKLVLRPPSRLATHAPIACDPG